MDSVTHSSNKLSVSDAISIPMNSRSSSGHDRGHRWHAKSVTSALESRSARLKCRCVASRIRAIVSARCVSALSAQPHQWSLGRQRQQWSWRVLDQADRRCCRLRRSKRQRSPDVLPSAGRCEAIGARRQWDGRECASHGRRRSHRLRSRSESDPYNSQWPRVHLTPVLLAKPVALLTSRELQNWRDGLLMKMAPSMINRLSGCLPTSDRPQSTQRHHFAGAFLTWGRSLNLVKRQHS